MDHRNPIQESDSEQRLSESDKNDPRFKRPSKKPIDEKDSRMTVVKQEKAGPIYISVAAYSDRHHAEDTVEGDLSRTSSLRRVSQVVRHWEESESGQRTSTDREEKTSCNETSQKQDMWKQGQEIRKQIIEQDQRWQSKKDRRQLEQVRQGKEEEERRLAKVVEIRHNANTGADFTHLPMPPIVKKLEDLVADAVNPQKDEKSERAVSFISICRYQ